MDRVSLLEVRTNIVRSFAESTASTKSAFVSAPATALSPASRAVDETFRGSVNTELKVNEISSLIRET